MLLVVQQHLGDRIDLVDFLLFYTRDVTSVSSYLFSEKDLFLVKRISSQVGSTLFSLRVDLIELLP